jgi:hypothetical protein
VSSTVSLFDLQEAEMPEIELWKIAVSLGVPGLALGVFYMLFRSFHWRFPSVPQKWVAPIIVLFMLVTAGIVLTALILWAPSNDAPSPQDVKDARVWFENLRLAYSPIPGGGSGGTGIPYSEFIAKDQLLEMLRGLDLSSDDSLREARNELVETIEMAKADPEGDIEMTHELKTGVEELRIQIRHKAVEHGIDVRDFSPLSPSGGGIISD